MKKFKPVFVLAFTACFASFVWASVHANNRASIDSFLEQRGSHYFELYKHFHANPELSLKEEKTAARVAAEFRAIGLETTERVGGFGVVGVLRNGEGPVGLVRGDMDALPIVEETGLPYSSQVPGVMHACGHDLHTTNLISVAEALVRFRSEWSGTLVFVAQPAEELGSGASAMIADGLFTRFPKPDYAIAIHSTPVLPWTQAGVHPGPAMASADFFDVTFNGKDAHASKPHEAIDPITLGAEFVLKIKGLVNNEIDAQKPAVLNVGSFHAGTKHNIIPRTSLIQVNMRTFHDDVRDHLMRRLGEVAVDLSRVNRADPPVVTHISNTPSLHNHLGMSAGLAEALRGVRGVELRTDYPAIMGAEDFSRYSREGRIPGLLFWTGVMNPDTPKPWPGAHTSKMAPDFLPAWKTSMRSLFHAVVHFQAKKPSAEPFGPAARFTPAELGRILYH